MVGAIKNKTKLIFEWVFLPLGRPGQYIIKMHKKRKRKTKEVEKMFMFKFFLSYLKL